MSEEELKQKIIDLEKDLTEKNNYIVHLEKMNNAYSILSDMFNNELKEADRILKAQEILQDLMIKERIEADQTIKAHENLELLTTYEKIQADQIIKAHENLEEYSIQEKIEMDRMLKAQEITNKLSMEELVERDKALSHILEVNKNISMFLEENILLKNILYSLAGIVHAQRGILFLREKNLLIPRLLLNMSRDELKKDYFLDSFKIIKDTIQKRKSCLVVNQKIELQDDNTITNQPVNISIISSPLIYKDNILGILYIDILSNSENFKERDLSLVEIFCSQASISINNSILYKEIKKKNNQLLKLINFRDQFIMHLSDDLSRPLVNIRDQLEKAINDKKDDPDERNGLIALTVSKLSRIQNTISKVLTTISLEEEVERLFKDNINFNETISHIFNKHNSVIKQKNLTISIKMQPEFNSFKANSLVIKVILDELISNAVYYNRPGGKIDIIGEVNDQYLSIDIIDTGYGIKNEDIDKIFEKFYRTANSAYLNENGAGLGLFMVKESIRHYGGKISVSSVYQEGSKFTISFLMH